MEREIPGMPGYRVRIGDGVDIVNQYGKTLNKTYQGKIMFTSFGQETHKVEDLVEKAFPELEKRDYIYKLYGGVKEKPRRNTLTVEIVPGVKLTKLYTPTAYYLETPVEIDLGKEIKKMFPGFHVNIIEGDSRRYWREIYFTSMECIRYVQQQFFDLFSEKSGLFSEDRDIYCKR